MRRNVRKRSYKKRPSNNRNHKRTKRNRRIQRGGGSCFSSPPFGPQCRTETQPEITLACGHYWHSNCLAEAMSKQKLTENLGRDVGKIPYLQKVPAGPYVCPMCWYSDTDTTPQVGRQFIHEHIGEFEEQGL